MSATAAVSAAAVLALMLVANGLPAGAAKTSRFLFPGGVTTGSAFGGRRLAQLDARYAILDGIFCEDPKIKGFKDILEADVCQDLCTQEEECRAFAHDAERLTCYLRPSCNMQVVMERGTSGIKLAPGESLPVATLLEPSYDVLNNTWCNDDKIIGFKDVSEVEDCRKRCSLEDACAVFSHDPARATCYLRPSCDLKLPAEGRTSGIKLATPPEPVVAVPVASSLKPPSRPPGSTLILLPSPPGSVPRSETCCENLPFLNPNNNRVCAHSQWAWQDCVEAATFRQAQVICKSSGARLCTIEEIAAKETNGSGCDFDTRRIWSLTECRAQETSAGGHVTALGADGSIPQCSVSNTETAAVRCCADVCNVGGLPDKRLPTASPVVDPKPVARPEVEPKPGSPAKGINPQILPPAGGEQPSSEQEDSSADDDLQASPSGQTQASPSSSNWEEFWASFAGLPMPPRAPPAIRESPNSAYWSEFWSDFN